MKFNPAKYKSNPSDNLPGVWASEDEYYQIREYSHLRDKTRPWIYQSVSWFGVYRKHDGRALTTAGALRSFDEAVAAVEDYDKRNPR